VLHRYYFALHYQEEGGARLPKLDAAIVSEPRWFLLSLSTTSFMHSHEDMDIQQAVQAQKHRYPIRLHFYRILSNSFSDKPLTT
jgi:hypothetical protein